MKKDLQKEDDNSNRQINSNVINDNVIQTKTKELSPEVVSKKQIISNNDNELTNLQSNKNTLNTMSHNINANTMIHQNTNLNVPTQNIIEEINSKEEIPKNVNNNPKIGRVSFWSTLFAITDIQINKTNRIICINFYSDEKQIDKQLRLVMVNLLFFKEALMKRMLKLKIKIEKQKLIKGHWQEKRLSSKDINKMTIEQSLNNLDDFLNRSSSNMQRSTNISQQQRYTYNRMSPSMSN